MNWQPGDKAIYDGPFEFRGSVVTIVNGPQTYMTRFGLVYGYEIDPGIPPNEGAVGWGARPHQLKPFQPNQKTVSWDQCVWRPAVLATVEQ